MTDDTNRIPGSCPWCVRVTCNHKTLRAGVLMWPCKWSGYRRRGDAHKPCPWCRTTVGPFTVNPVFHKLSKICTFGPKPRMDA